MKKWAAAVADEADEEMEEIKGPIVKIPAEKREWRDGKGYSYKEIEAADVPIDDLKRAGVPVDTRRKSMHQTNVEELGALYRQIVASDTIALSFDEGAAMHRKQAIRNLRKLSNVSKSDAEILVDGGIFSITHLAEEDPKTLSKDLDLDNNKVKDFVEAAKSVKLLMDAKSTFKKLSKIKGIKKKYITPLLELEVNNIDDLIDSNPEKVAEKLKIELDEVLYWINQAKEIKGIAEPELEEDVELPKKKKGKKILVEPEEEFEEKEQLEELEEEIEDIEGEKGETEEITEEKTEEKTEEMDAEEIKENAKKELLKCKGIGKKTAEKLIDVGILSIKDLIKADPIELEEMSGISSTMIEKYQQAAQDID
jgi:ribosomal protein L13E/predicted flap endonuclease-1-like 5' DNA nuclease